MYTINGCIVDSQIFTSIGIVQVINYEKSRVMCKSLPFLNRFIINYLVFFICLIYTDFVNHPKFRLN